ncbi:glycosyltransferase [Megasphaera paucivorans]|uniref:Glycosyltransferase involved in cell wall bisynthesis n=1 Tax=Megasphaera paucivorans TaxID=349095 RepID=A0A1G9PVP8_9FIRM|nr:glycosyltransferase [Megasphaera paucivorans]SDM02846.1 Glycosyltransferase involved in cell wall bisynthesis [Megasphaera paucivorans]
MTKLSIIVPIYNAEKYLEDTIKSILRQSYYDFELLLVDDGSTDSSLKICNKFLLQDARIRVLHKENGGVSSARNSGLTESIGQYIVFVDADDLIEPDMYQNLIEALERSHADIAMCGFVAEVIYKPSVYNFSTVPIICRHPLELLLNEKVGTGCIWNKVFCKNLIKSVRFDETIVYSEDQLFITEVLMQCNTVVVLPQILYHYMQHPSSLSWQDGNYDIWKGNFRARKRIYQLILSQKSEEVLQKYAFEEYVKAIFALIRYTIKYREKDEYYHIINRYGVIINKYLDSGAVSYGKFWEYKTYIKSYRIASIIHYYPKYLKNIKH